MNKLLLHQGLWGQKYSGRVEGFRNLQTLHCFWMLWWSFDKTISINQQCVPFGNVTSIWKITMFDRSIIELNGPWLPAQIVVLPVFQWSMTIHDYHDSSTIHPLFIPWFIHNSSILVGCTNGLVSEHRHRKPLIFPLEMSIFAVHVPFNPLTK